MSPPATPIVVIGAGGSGREVVDALRAAELAAPGTHLVLGVVDDHPTPIDRRRLSRAGMPYLGSIDEWLADDPDTEFIVGIADPATRLRIATRLEAAGLRAGRCIHPQSHPAEDFDVPAGSAVFPGAVVQSNVVAGPHLFVQPNVVVGHDSVIGTAVNINPLAVLSVATVGDRVTIGMGAKVLHGVRVGDDSTVGANAVVVRDVSAGVVVKGVPAR